MREYYHKQNVDGGREREREREIYLHPGQGFRAPVNIANEPPLGCVVYLTETCSERITSEWEPQ